MPRLPSRCSAAVRTPPATTKVGYYKRPVLFEALNNGELRMLAAQTVPPIVQALVPLALGLYGTLSGYGILPVSSDPKKAAAQKRLLSTYKFGGPLLIVVGLAMLARAMWL